MSKYLTVDYSNTLSFISEKELHEIEIEIQEAHRKLVNRTGKGSDFLGWLSLPEKYDREEFSRIQKASNKIRKDSEILLVIGIGGSYLGSKAAIDMLNKHFDRDK